MSPARISTSGGSRRGEASNAPVPARAASRWRLAPERPDSALQPREPRGLVETLTPLDVVKRLRELESVKEVLDSTNYRRYYQLIAYFEKELGLDYKELLDKL